MSIVNRFRASRWYVTVSAQILAVALVVARASADGAAPSACAPSPSGILSWWPGENSSADPIRGFDGAVQGGAGYSSGLVGSAFNFDASGTQFVLVPSHNEFNLQHLTLCAWVFPTSLPNAFPSIVRRDVTFRGATQMALALTSDGHAEAFIQNTVSMVNGTVPLNQWTHIAFTYDRSIARLFVNGAVVDSQVATGPVPSSDQPLCIGAENGFTIRNFAGRIDEVMVFGRALSSLEIQSIWAAGADGVCQPTALLRELLFSVDHMSKNLVIIDTEVGTVTQGPALGNTDDTDLATADSSLYVLDSHCATTLFSVSLIRVDRRTLHVMSTVPVTYNGIAVACAEGLAALGDDLFVAFTDGAPTNTYSNTLGRLDRDGTIHDVVHLDDPNTGTAADADGLAASSNGALFLLDGNPYDPAQPSFNNYELAEVLPGSQNWTTRGYYQPFLRVDDLVAGSTGILWVPDTANNSLLRMSAVDGSIIGRTMLQTTDPLLGIALAGTFGTPTSVEGQAAAAGAVRAFPNPSSGYVHFHIDSGRESVISVYDLAGRLVWRRERASGVSTWDGRDQAGGNLASGVYFARIETGGRTSYSKIVLNR